jgi:Ca-activated chloride channel family protein
MSPFSGLADRLRRIDRAGVTGLYHAGYGAGGRWPARSMPGRRVSSVLFWGPLLLLGASLSSQPAAPQFSSGVQLVEVYASVTDAGGMPVADLRQSDFEVLEDGVQQTVSVFASGEFPLTLALGVDRSFSMAGEPLRQAKQAARAFLSELRPEDRVTVVSISADAEVVAPLSTDRAVQARAIDSLTPWSTTALHDALVLMLDRLEAETGRVAVVVFSDGVDRYSHASAPQLLAHASTGSTLVYPITIGRQQPKVMGELARVSGGRAFTLGSIATLQATLATVARELRRQYLLGYVPRRTADAGGAGWRSIRVRLSNPRPGVQIRAREGYRAN